MMDSMFIDGTSVIICTYPLQDGWTALMKAFDSGENGVRKDAVR